jgi:hypothetical protein
MPTLHAYLTTGFAGDHVVVRVDGRTVFDARDVTTRKLLGLARSIEPVTVSGTTAAVEIELPARGLRQSFTVDLSRGSHVPIAIDGGAVTFAVVKQIGFA